VVELQLIHILRRKLYIFPGKKLYLNYILLKFECMKKITFLLTALVLGGLAFIMFGILGCSREPEATNRIETSASIEFKSDGVLKQYSQVNAASISAGTGKAYTFVATKNPTSENYFSLTIYTDSLRVGLHQASVVNFREGSETGYNSAPFTVMVLSNSGGVVEATFTGQIMTNTFRTVTEGKINNVQILY
jgi:hypothetical protein